MQNLQTGEMHEISPANAAAVDAHRSQRNNALLQVDFKGIPVDAGHQGPVFRVGEEITLQAQAIAPSKGAAREGTIVQLRVSAIQKKAIMLMVTLGGDASDTFKRGHVIEIKGGRFRVGSAGRTMVQLVGLPGIKWMDKY